MWNTKTNQQQINEIKAILFWMNKKSQQLLLLYMVSVKSYLNMNMSLRGV